MRMPTVTSLDVVLRAATDLSSEVPPTDLLPYRPARARPYLYSHDEVRRPLEQALQLSGASGLRPWTCHALLRLLSVTGMRVGEALRLRLDDV
jgi:integrase/recombinase XerD